MPVVEHDVEVLFGGALAVQTVIGYLFGVALVFLEILGVLLHYLELNQRLVFIGTCEDIFLSGLLVLDCEDSVQVRAMGVVESGEAHIFFFKII